MFKTFTRPIISPLLKICAALNYLKQILRSVHNNLYLMQGKEQQ